MISKQLFVESIEAIRLQMNDDKKNAELLREALNIDQSLNLYDNTKLHYAIINLLRQYFPPEENHCEIIHYCYVLDFGKCGENHQSPEELYDRLCGTVEH